LKLRRLNSIGYEDVMNGRPKRLFAVLALSYIENRISLALCRVLRIRRARQSRAELGAEHRMGQRGYASCSQSPKLDSVKIVFHFPQIEPSLRADGSANYWDAHIVGADVKLT
jgi:hypothetical protein